MAMGLSGCVTQTHYDVIMLPGLFLLESYLVEYQIICLIRFGWAVCPFCFRGNDRYNLSTIDAGAETDLIEESMLHMGEE